MIVITQRCVKALELICNGTGSVTARQISEKLNVSERTVRYDVSILSDWLAEKGISLSSIPKKGIYIRDNDKDQVRTLIDQFHRSNGSRDILLNSDERIRMMVANILEGHENETIDDAAESLGVSRTTFLRDMEKTEEWFAAHKAQLKRRQKHGVHLEVGEIQRRRLIVEFIVENLNEKSFLSYILMHDQCDSSVILEQCGFSYINRIFGSVDFGKLIDLVNDYLKKFNIMLKDSAFISLIYYLTVMITRVRDGKYIDTLPDKYSQFEDMSQCYEIEENLEKQLEIAIPQRYLHNEAVFITTSIFASTKNRTVRVSRKNTETADRIYRFLHDEICRRLDCDIYNDKEMASGLRTHLQASIVRIQLDIPVRNAMIDEIKTRFSDLFAVCSEVADDIRKTFSIKFDENEVGFITLYIATAMERMHETMLKPISVKAVLICGYGVGTVTFLTRSLEKQFPNIKILDKLSVFEIEKYDFSRVDIILSTINIPLILPKPFIKVNPIITKLDVRRIDSLLRTAHTITDSTAKDFRVDELLGIISENCEIKDTKKLGSELSTVMSKYTSPMPSIADLPTLLDILSKKYMVANIEASNWEEAVAKSAQPLLTNNCITQEYIDAIINIKNLYNQYSVISNGVCIPHAWPCEFSKLAMSLATLKKPVEILINGKLIEIRVFMVLSLVDTMAHAKVLDEIFSMLDEFPDFVDDLCRASSTEELCRIFKMYYDKLF